MALKGPDCCKLTTLFVTLQAAVNMEIMAFENRTVTFIRGLCLTGSRMERRYRLRDFEHATKFEYFYI